MKYYICYIIIYYILYRNSTKQLLLSIYLYIMKFKYYINYILYLLFL